MNELEVFSFDNAEVRTLVQDNEPWFVGKDVADILGYKKPSNALLKHVDPEDKQFLMLDIADPQNGDVPKGQTKTAVINESGLYSLILSSKLPSAKQFKRWITSEVLPTIRRHGAYLTDDKIAEVLTNPDTIIRLATSLKEEREQRLIAEQQLHELQPKATYYDLVLQNESLISVSKIAKDYGKSAFWLNKKLHELGVQFKQGDMWLLYQKHAEQGYTQSTTHVIDAEHIRLHTRWTQKGRLFIYALLKNAGYLPLIEQEG